MNERDIIYTLSYIYKIYMKLFIAVRSHDHFNSHHFYWCLVRSSLEAVQIGVYIYPSITYVLVIVYVCPILFALLFICDIFVWTALSVRILLSVYIVVSIPMEKLHLDFQQSYSSARRCWFSIQCFNCILVCHTSWSYSM